MSEQATPRRDPGSMPDGRVRLVEEHGERLAQKARDPGVPGGWRTEIAALSSIRSPHVVRLRGFGPDAVLSLDGHGESLREHLNAGRDIDIDGVLRDLSAALIACHRAGWVHNDVKPENLVQAPWGWVLVDFELATPPGLHVHDAGTPAYVAPERLTGRAEHASDWYSFGVLAMELITGSLPFDGPIDQHLFGVPPEVVHPLGSLISRLLRKEPERRPHGEQIIKILGATRAASARPAPTRSYAPHEAYIERMVPASTREAEVVGHRGWVTFGGRTERARLWATNGEGALVWWNGGDVHHTAHRVPLALHGGRLRDLVAHRSRVAWRTVRRIVMWDRNNRSEWAAPDGARCIAVGPVGLWVATTRRVRDLTRGIDYGVSGAIRALSVGSEALAVHVSEGWNATGWVDGVERQQPIAPVFATSGGVVFWQGELGWIRAWHPRLGRPVTVARLPPVSDLWVHARHGALVGRSADRRLHRKRFDVSMIHHEVHEQ